MRIDRDWQDYCDICPERNIGIIKVNGIVFCDKCEKREFVHAVRLMEKAVEAVRAGFGK